MASKSPIRVAVTGAAGNIGYAAIFRLASGAVFGADQPVALNLIEVGPGLNALAGVVMELQDCAFPLLTDVVATGDLNEGFKDADWCLLIGAVPRKDGMERKDLLGINGKIFIGQGEAIARNAKKSVKVLVVGNPCNTNALIALRSAGSVPTENFFAMTRLDENRAKSQLAGKAGAHNSVVKNVAIWGNHSSTQYPDFTNATIGGQPAMQVITDHAWLKETFVSDVQKRGAASSRPVAPLRQLPPLTPPSTPCAASTSRLRLANGTPSLSCPRVTTVSRRALCSATRSAPRPTVHGKSSRVSRSTPSPRRRSPSPRRSCSKSAPPPRKPLA